MTRSDRPFLLDVTRLIARSWTRRLSTGIDRVCYAYLRHFAARAHAVVQHRGVFRILPQRQSDTLFEMLRDTDTHFRSRMLRFAPGAFASGTSQVDGDGRVYINVSHTDFDLDSHVRWTERCRLRSTYLIHDLIPITDPQFCRRHAVKRHHGRVVNALRTASGIMVTSSSTAVELEDFARSQRLPMPPTLTAALAGASLNGAMAARRALDTPYFLCVGTIEPRKNHLMLLQIWRQMVERMGRNTPKLVIVGQWGAQSQPVRDMLRTCTTLGDHVTLHTRCSDRELTAWIAGARAVLMPTLAEGFGLPMVEALKLGVPVIASDLPCFREFGQGIPTLVAPLDLSAWERTIVSFLEHAPEHKRQLDAIGAFQAPTWENHFSDVEAWFQKLPLRSAAGWTARSGAARMCAGTNPT